MRELRDLPQLRQSLERDLAPLLTTPSFVIFSAVANCRDAELDKCCCRISNRCGKFIGFYAKKKQFLSRLALEPQRISGKRDPSDIVSCGRIVLLSYALRSIAGHPLLQQV